MSVPSEIRKKLDSLIVDINSAMERGIKIEFNLQQDPTGRFSLGRFETWTKMPDEGTRTQ